MTSARGKGLGPRTTIVGAILAVGLAWRTAGGAASAWREVRAVPLERLAASVTADREQRLRWTTRGDYELYCAVRDHVPATERLVLVAPGTQAAPWQTSERTTRVYSTLRSLLEDRPVTVLDPGADVSRLGKLSGRVSLYVLDLEPDDADPWRAHVETVTRGRGFLLGRLRGEGQ